MRDLTIEQWVIRSIEDLYKKNELLNERIEFLENKLMNKEEKEYIEKHGAN